MAERVLIVDDDATARAICKGLLETEYEVELVQSGLQALGFLMEAEDKRPDVILLDMHMPGMGGIETLGAIRKNAAVSTIPVILMDELANEHAEVEGFISGADDFVHKPILPDLLKVRVKHQLEIYRLRRENAALKKKLNRIKMTVARICAEPD